MTSAPETIARLHTATDVWDRPGNWELVRGELREMAPPGGEHGVRTMRLGTRLSNFVEAKQLGTVFAAETGFLIAEDPDTVRGPDVSFIALARSPERWPGGWIPICPDLVVEVVSPNDRIGEIEDKVADWLSAGVPLMWVVYPGSHTIQVHRPGEGVRILNETDALDGEEVVPGFTLPVREIFS